MKSEIGKNFDMLLFLLEKIRIKKDNIVFQFFSYIQIKFYF